MSRSGYALSDGDENPLFYEKLSARTGAPKASVVLSDGIGCEGYVWKYLKRDLASDFDILHWQYRGHGRSPNRDRSHLTIQQFGRDLWSVVDDCDTDKVVLVGHSMGVQVSLEAYRLQPERVSAMVLLCGMAENPLKTFRGTAGLEDALPLIRQTIARAPNLFRRMGRTLLPTKLAYSVAKQFEINGTLIDPADFMPYLHGMSRIDPEDFIALLQSAGEHSAVDLLSSISVPVLVVGGSDDGFTPPELSQKIADAIPDSELLLVEDGSHTAPLERPDFVNEIILRFLSRCAPELKQ